MTDHAFPVDFYFYQYWLTKVVDGDTINGDLDFGLNLNRGGYGTRFYAINTPEKYGRTSWIDDQEFARDLALAAESFMAMCVEPLDRYIPVRTHKDTTGKYGRLLITVYAEQSKVDKALDWWNVHPLFHERLNGKALHWSVDKLYERLVKAAPGLIRHPDHAEPLMNLNRVLVFNSLAQPNFYDTESKQLLKGANRSPYAD